MKSIAILLLDIYKGVLAPFTRSVLGIHTTCRFSPSCSEYMKKMISQHGFYSGFKKGLNQLIKCHPLGGVYGTNI